MPLTALDTYGELPVVIETRRYGTGNSAVSHEGRIFEWTDSPLATRGSYSLRLSADYSGRGAVVIAVKSSVEDDPLEGFAAFQEDNWDSEGGRGIGVDTLSAAREILAKLPVWVDSPEAAPATDGSIGFEWVWESKGRPVKIFIDVGPGRRVITYIRDARGWTSEKIKSLDDLDIQDHLQALFIRANASTAEAA